MAKLVIFGNGKIAEVAAFYFDHDSEHEVVAFTCDRDYIKTDTFLTRPLLPFEDVENVYPASQFAMFVAVGYHDLNRLRASKYEAAKKKGYRLVSYVSSRSWPGSHLKTGDNCLILDAVSVQPGATIGNNVALWSNVVVGHHAVIGDHCWLASGTTVGGGSKIEPFCFAGLNCTIGNEVDIGHGSILGAASLVTKSQPAEGVFIAKESERLRLDSNRFMMISKMK